MNHIMGNRYREKMSNYLFTDNDGLKLRNSKRWAELKLDYMARYIDVFEASMKNKWKTRFFIDLCAGPGKNILDNTNRIILGSLLIALTTRFPFTNYRFIELDHENADALKQRCSLYSNLDIKIIEGDANKNISKVIDEIPASSLNLAFIDPQGADITWATVERLGRVSKMDLIIYYPELSLKRNMDIWFDASHETKMDAFFGTRDWRIVYAKWRNNPKVSGIHAELIDLYKANLSNLGYKFIKDGSSINPVIDNTKGGHLYRLLFASKNDLGERFWIEVTKRDAQGQKRLL